MEKAEKLTGGFGKCMNYITCIKLEEPMDVVYGNCTMFGKGNPGYCSMNPPDNKADKKRLI